MMPSDPLVSHRAADAPVSLTPAHGGAPAHARPDGARERVTDAARGTVLVVDDTEANRFAMARMLEAAGFAVREAGSGGEVLALVAEPATRPDVIVLDVRLPDLLGFEVARRLKADPATTAIPILHISASFTTAESAVEGLEAGAEGYLTHPVEPRVLVATVRSMLRGAEAESRLRASEAQARASLAELASIYRSTPVGLAVLDAALRFVRVNERLAAASGASVEAHVGHTPGEMLPALAPVLEAALARVRTSGEALHDVELRGEVPARPGEPRAWVAQCLPLLDAAGVVTGVSVVLDDVTDRRRQEVEREALLTRERRLRQRLERLQELAAALAPVLDVGRAAEIVLQAGVAALDARLASLGLLAADGATFEVVASVGMPDDVVARWRHFPNEGELPWVRVAAARAPLFLESPAALAAFPEFGDTPRLLGLHAEYDVPLLDAAGTVLGVASFAFGAARPVSEDDRRFLDALARHAVLAIERARLHAAEQAARLAAEGASRAKSEFLANMSHELRTPLNAIQGHVQLLEMGLYGPVEEAQRTALGRVTRAQQHLLGLINDVLNYAKLEAGKVEYDLRAVDLRALLDDTTPLIEPQRLAKRQRWSVELPDGACSVWADRDKLAQILLNLYSNAVKFTPEAGTIGVRVSTPPDAPDAVLVEVRDTGVGIPADRLDAIFEPFVQVRAGHRATQEGTGLGLTISRDLVRGMGGELAATSEIGVGSTFRLTLRRATP